jgi:hypothetical protein
VDFAWSEGQRQLREIIIKFARKELQRRLTDPHEADAFDLSGWKKCGTLGIEVEQDLRDTLGGRFFSGTSEIQRQIIAQFMGL